MNIIRILLFDGVELLDFAGPLEVFTVADYLLGEDSSFEIKTISMKESITVSKSEIKIIANITKEPDPVDLLVIPGGIGTRAIINDPIHLEFINQLTIRSSINSSVCTGALILAKLGMLENMNVTTHKAGVPLLQQLSPSSNIERSKRFIDEGTIITSAGISAGIDMSLYVLEKFHGIELRQEVQQYMEYNT